MKTLLFLALAVLSSSILAKDPLFHEQWAHRNVGQKIYRSESDIRREVVHGIAGVDIDIPTQATMDELNKGAEVIVAVIDSGIDPLHPEFKGRLYQGFDLLDNEKMSDDMGHGTHVAGIIVANVDGQGIEGVTPSQVKILPLKVLSKNTTSFVYKGKLITDIVANAISIAIESKAQVINMSMGWPQLINTPKIIKTLDAAAEKGIVIVAASGNNNKDVPTWPCSHPAVICVGAIDNQGNLTEFSNHGGKVDLVAPGEWIVSTNPRTLESRTLRIQGYEAKNGSSQASPFVAAAAALLKLKDPKLSAQDIKARLYASAKPMNKDKDRRFVRFGSLSIKDALELKDPKIASVLTKNLTTVSVDQEGAFNFTLPLEILGHVKGKPRVALSGLAARVSLEGPSIRLTGHLPDLNRDSEVTVNFIVTIDGVDTKTDVTLSFARSLKDEDLISSKIRGIPASQLMTIQGQVRTARIGHVSVEDEAQSDFFGFIQSKKNDEITIGLIRANADGTEARTEKVILKGHHQLLSIFEKDVNIDGVPDLVFYGMSAKRTHLLLTFTDQTGAPLFGAKSTWELPISTFEGLPLKDGERADFAWLKVNTPLGELLVPYYQKPWNLPVEDNSTDLVDYEEDAVDNRLFYWEPFVEAEKIAARPRVVDSVTFKKAIRKKLKLNSRDGLKIERLLPQTAEEKKRGSARHLVSVGETFNRTYYILTVEAPGKYSLALHHDQDVFQSDNNILVTRKLNDFSISPNSFLMAMFDRKSARVKPVLYNGTSPEWMLETSGWSNPFFEIVASFETSERRIMFFESRYHVYVYEQYQEEAPVSRRLPINRDSSFPGVNFSETLQPAVVKAGNHKEPAVAINSTLIFGDRLYSMVSKRHSLGRPISLSVSIPVHCVPTKTQILKTTLKYSAYTLLCQDSSGEVSINFFPLELK